MLKHHGYNVTILEQETSPRREGYDAGIKVGPANEEFLKRHDRVQRDMIIKCDPGYMIDVNGRPKPQRGQTMLMTSWGLMVSILRANFDGLTSSAVPVAPQPETTDGNAWFRFGTRVTDIEDINGRVKMSFLSADSGTTETLLADIAIVADGSNSTIRQMLLPDVKREYSGYMCWRGTVREGDVDEKWNSIYSEKATFHLMDRTYLLKQVLSPQIPRACRLILQLYNPYRQRQSRQGPASSQLDMVLEPAPIFSRNDHTLHRQEWCASTRHCSPRPCASRPVGNPEGPCPLTAPAGPCSHCLYLESAIRHQSVRRYKHQGIFLRWQSLPYGRRADHAETQCRYGYHACGK